MSWMTCTAKKAMGGLVWGNKQKASLKSSPDRPLANQVPCRCAVIAATHVIDSAKLEGILVGQQEPPTVRVQDFHVPSILNSLKIRTARIMGWIREHRANSLRQGQVRTLG